MSNATNTWFEGEFLIESFKNELIISRDNRSIYFYDQSAISLFTWFTNDLTDIFLIEEYFDNYSILQGSNND